jgi:predicted cupin superfamily sugar epimerase
MTELPNWARHLNLSPNPEGGWFKEMWRSDLTVACRRCHPTTPVRAARARRYCC